MTGNSEPSWNWLHNVVVPALLAVTETTWVSLCLSAAANGSRHLRVDLPFLGFALPAVLAVTVVGLSGRLRWRWWWRTLALLPVLLVGAALTAGVLSELSIGGSFAAVAAHPWTVTGRVPSDTASLAWLVGVLMWVRGAWLGATQVTFVNATRSIATSVAGWVLIVAVLAGVHQPTVHAATPGAALLFIVFFAIGIAVLALIRERDIEADAHVRGARGPGTTWLSILVIPLLGVAGLALALAAAFGPLAPWVGRALRDVATGIWRAIIFVAHKIADLFPASQVKPRVSGRGPRSSHPLTRLPTSTQHLAVPAAFWDAMVVIAAIAVLAVVVWFIRNVLPKLKAAPPATATVDEERDSVFSWTRLFQRLRAWLSRLLTRRRRRSDTPPPGDGVAVEPDVEAGFGIRFEYRRLLVAVREHGHGRGQAETTNELERRLLGAVLGERATGDLRDLTSLYDHTRYGHLEPDGHLIASAQLASDAVIDALRAAAEQAAAEQAAVELALAEQAVSQPVLSDPAAKE